MLITHIEKWNKQRESLDKYFTNETKCHLYKEEKFNEYTLKIFSYKTEEGCWEFTRGIITKKDEIIADIKRNYHSFPYCFIEHDNGNDYLVCGEDYQGYTIVNLTTKVKETYMFPNWDKGWGFCWSDIEGDSNRLFVKGCYWGGNYESVIYDFTKPEVLPLLEINRYDIDSNDDEDEDDYDEDDYDDDDDD